MVLFCVHALANGNKEIPKILSIVNPAQKLTLDIQLDLDFYKDFKLNKSKIAAQGITLRNASKQWFTFNPDDHDSLQSSKGYYAKVWSPSFDYLVLPLGRFEGFALYSVKYIQDSMGRLITKQYYGADLIPERTFKMASEFGPALWHEFVGWEGKNTLIIRVGLGKDFKQFKYDIENNKLSGYKHWKGQVTRMQFLAAD